MPTTFTFHEQFDGRPASGSVRGGRKLTRRWECVTSELCDGVAVIEALTAQEGIYFGVEHPSYAACLCEDITADPDGDDYYTWMVQADYLEPKALPGFVPGLPNGGTVGGQPGAGGSGTPYQPPKPWDRPALFSLDFTKVPRYFTEDYDGKALVNAVGDPLEDVPPIYYPRATIRCTKYYDSWSVDLGIAVHSRVNMDTWLGFDPGTCLIEACPAKPVTQGAYGYWQVDWTIAYEPDGWNPTKLLNVGRRYFRSVIKAGGGFQQIKTAIVDETGKELPGLHLLKADGSDVLPPGQPPVELSFRFYGEVNFNGLIDP